jgi:hypothetical protein
VRNKNKKSCDKKKTTKPCSVSFQCFLKKRLHHHTDPDQTFFKQKKERETHDSHNINKLECGIKVAALRPFAL